MASTKRVYFTVRGKYGFPFDMLRYDQAWPTDRGVSGLGRVTRGDNRDYDDEGSLSKVEPVDIELVSASPHAPTDDRWHSFGWLVIKKETRSY
jgi:hypothetical protein